MNGADVLLAVEDAVTPGTYITIGSQRGVTFTESNEEIDESSKDAREWKGSAGRYKSTCSLDALYVPNDTAYTALKDAVRNGTKVVVARSEAGTETETASAFVSNLSEEAPDQQESTVSVDLSIDGAWTAV